MSIMMDLQSARAALLATAACLSAAGCASTSVYVDRESETGIDDGEKIAIVVSPPKRSTATPGDLGSVELGFENCLQPEIRDAAPHASFIPAAEFHALSAVRALDVDWRERPRKLLRRMAESRAADELATSGVHYLVILSARSGASAPRAEVGGSGGAVAVGTSRDTHVSLQATVLDLKRKREAGWIDSYASGVQGGGVGLVYIVPVPIAFFTPFMDSSACSALGRELGKFIAGG